MKIKKVVVNNLFGIFHHEIPLNMENHITIIHGPNGFGKTTLLKMINALFCSRYYELRRIPFDELFVDFDDKSKLHITKKVKHPNGKISPEECNELTIEFKKGRSKPLSYIVKPLKQQEIPFPLGALEGEIPGLDRIGRETWLYTPTQEKLTLIEVLDRFKDYLPPPFLRTLGETEPEWLKNIRKSIPTRFIETQRLLFFSPSRRPRDYEGRPSMIPAVINYSEQVTNMIQSTLAEYATLSQSLDRTFPTRLVKGGSATELTLDDLRTNLDELEKKRSRLIEAGLLDKGKEVDLKDLQNIDEKNRNVLSVYIDDVKKKLRFLEDLTNKIDLLVKNINSRFLYKKMSISKKDGFIFKTADGNEISPIMLSSGEQHEIVLLFELLFKVKPNTLILIDEPEISLHVAWQQQFLKDLHGITKLADFDVLIATHSPQIIHDRWDLTVKLEGPQN